MSQNEVYRYLKENKGKKLSIGTVAKALDTNYNTVRRKLNRLTSMKDVRMRVDPPKPNKPQKWFWIE